jgi:hypothetical protein
MRTNRVVSFVELQGHYYEFQAFFFCYCGEYPTLPVVKDKEGNPGPVPFFKSMPTSDSKVLTHVSDPCLALLGKHPRMSEGSEVLPVPAGKLIFKYEQKRQNLIGIWTVDIPLYCMYMFRKANPFYFLEV